MVKIKNERGSKGFLLFLFYRDIYMPLYETKEVKTMMKFIWAILGSILILPIAAVVVALIAMTLVGGYVALMLQVAWKLVLALLLVWIIIKIVKYFF